MQLQQIQDLTGLTNNCKIVESYMKYFDIMRNSRPLRCYKGN